jgi:hypothetical protein
VRFFIFGSLPLMLALCVALPVVAQDRSSTDAQTPTSPAPQTRQPLTYAIAGIASLGAATATQLLAFGAGNLAYDSTTQDRSDPNWDQPGGSNDANVRMLITYFAVSVPGMLFLPPLATGAAYGFEGNYWGGLGGSALGLLAGAALGVGTNSGTGAIASVTIGSALGAFVGYTLTLPSDSSEAAIGRGDSLEPETQIRIAPIIGGATTGLSVFGTF